MEKTPNTTHIDTNEPNEIVYSPEAELAAVAIGEIIEPVGDFWPEEIDEKDPETEIAQ
jgi:hypothetical protein